MSHILNSNFFCGSGITDTHYLVGRKKVLLEHLDTYKQTSQKVGMEEGKKGDRENIYKKINKN